MFTQVQTAPSFLRVLWMFKYFRVNHCRLKKVQPRERKNVIFQIISSNSFFSQNAQPCQLLASHLVLRTSVFQGNKISSPRLPSAFLSSSAIGLLPSLFSIAFCHVPSSSFPAFSTTSSSDDEDAEELPEDEDLPDFFFLSRLSLNRGSGRHKGFRVVNDQIVDGTDIIRSTNSVSDLDKTSSYQFVARADKRGRCGYFFVLLLRLLLILSLLFGRPDRFVQLPFVYQGFRGRAQVRK